MCYRRYRKGIDPPRAPSRGDPEGWNWKEVFVKRDENREVRPSWEETTEEYSFDKLARRLASGTISRRQALKWMGAGIVGAAVATAGFPNTAQALTRRQKRRCRDKEGIPLENGHCHCAFK